eukprot:gnl/Chilomastix_cuspidata/1602.p1 GENE.gnl/Chilomastix_cuspidata/1602~~gnl/Chilomastix_cuspidata/1602.p1  ORF type:complete len:750 (+),score=365.31 gnl/Chilomastix_cuspidata/1602:62-2311(+)
MSKTKLFANLLPVVYQQIIHGCKNPFCENVYCRSCQNNRVYTFYDGASLNSQLVVTTALDKNLSLICDVPVKFLLSRSKFSQFNSKFCMFDAVDMRMDQEVHGTFEETDRVLPVPFDSDLIAARVLVTRPLESFRAFGSFLSTGTSSLREAFLNARSYFLMMLHSRLRERFLGTLRDLMGRPGAPAPLSQNAVMPLAYTLLAQVQHPDFEICFVEASNLVARATDEFRAALQGGLENILSEVPEEPRGKVFGLLSAAAKQRVVLPLVVESSRVAEILTRDRLSPESVTEISAGLHILDLSWRLNETFHVFEPKYFNNEVLNDFKQYNLSQDLRAFIETDGFSFLRHPYLFSPRTKSRLMKAELRHIHSAVAPVLPFMFPFPMFRGEIRVPKRHTIVVSRENIIQDTITQLSKATPDQLSSELRVVFRGEPGIDEGGVSTEFFHIITRRLLSPNFGMFTYNPRTRFFWFNKWLDLSGPDASALLLQFELIGKVFGLAMSNSVNINARFPPVFYKKLVRPDAPLHLSDLAPLDPPLHRSLTEVLAYDGEDFTDVFGLVFAVDKEWLGHRSAHPLVEGGEHIDVTLENRAQFVELYVEFELQRSIERQFDAFRRGFFAVLKCRTFALLTPHDLRLALNGLSFIGLGRLQPFSSYEGFEGAEHVVRWFWEVVQDLPKSKQRKLLQFVTGSDRLPVEGMESLRFKIHANGSNDMMLPTSHVCFNVLMLPKYSSKAVLRERLLTAIENAEGFGLK